MQHIASCTTSLVFVSAKPIGKNSLNVCTLGMQRVDDTRATSYVASMDRCCTYTVLTWLHSPSVVWLSFPVP